MYRYLLYFLLFCILIFVSGIGYSLYEKYPVSPTELQVKKGYTVSQIAELLKEKGVIQNGFLFVLYTKIRGKPLKYGYYRFEGSLSIADVWEILQSGREKLIKFTIYPGDDLIDIGNRLEKADIMPRNVFFSYVFNPKNVKKYSLQGSSFEGYFPPDTYFLSRHTDVEKLVKVFLNRFFQKYPSALKPVENLTPYEVMIIASMVEKETPLKEEKPIIAGVIINRLKKGMKLQIDPTVIYALKLAGLWKGRLKKEDMDFPSPYNTYLNKGLPPTPISSFTLDTVLSVVNYKKTRYLYFYSKDGKKHIFSETYRQHIKNIK